MRRSGTLALVAAAALLLAACAPVASKPTSSAKPSTSATAAPSATPSESAAALPGDVLFKITATVTSADGTVASVTEIVHQPVDQTDHQAGDTAQLDNECDGWRQAFSNTQFLVADVTTSVTGGGSWSDGDRIAVDMGGYPVWTGDQDPYQALCATAVAHVPGIAHAVSPVAGGKADGDGGWAVFRYGFSTADAAPASGSTASAAPSAGAMQFSKCRIQMGPASKSSIFASAWSSHPETDGGTACRFGGTD
jgi:hypothetical protein